MPPVEVNDTNLQYTPANKDVIHANAARTPGSMEAAEGRAIVVDEGGALELEEI